MAVSNVCFQSPPLSFSVHWSDSIWTRYIELENTDTEIKRMLVSMGADPDGEEILNFGSDNKPAPRLRTGHADIVN